MKVSSADFVKSCVASNQYPKECLPEVAFLGRSNVGKSSTINALLKRKGLAKVSMTPGKTQTINFFRIASTDTLLKHFFLVDLPGAGYAKVPRTLREQWGPMIETYLTARAGLCGVVLLVDIRRNDTNGVETVEWIRHLGHEPLVVVTKADKLSRSHRQAALRQIQQSLPVNLAHQVILYSAHTHEGHQELWKAIRHMVGGQQRGMNL
ncbi:MAG: YihA family ribosome biogenesis GTP-binding protein [Nitrospirales bacterium]|nr:YihA family ribosome biogenesis GTP-binding protein [Nitrospirales bacterium]